jgi:lipopolysaccharide export system ATP-binding protein
MYEQNKKVNIKSKELMSNIKKFRIKSFKNNNTIIEFRKYFFNIWKKLILDRFNFSINEGQIFGLLGPNGVGKSTIFNLITGLLSQIMEQF